MSKIISSIHWIINVLKFEYWIQLSLLINGKTKPQIFENIKNDLPEDIVQIDIKVIVLNARLVTFALVLTREIFILPKSLTNVTFCFNRFLFQSQKFPKSCSGWKSGQKATFFQNYSRLFRIILGVISWLLIFSYF